MPLPDEGIKIAALPAASSPDAIDLVGVQAGVTKKLASTLLATQAELDAVNAAAAHLAGAETFTGAKTISLAAAGPSLTITKEATNMEGGSLRIGRTTAASHAQSISFATGTAVDYIIGRTANSDNLSFGYSGGSSFNETIRFDTSGNVRAIGNDMFFGAGAMGGTGTHIQLGSLADPNFAFVISQGSVANVGLNLRAKGTGNVQIQSGDSTNKVQANNTGLGFFGTAPVAKPTGVAVTAAGIHAALVTLGLIAA